MIESIKAEAQKQLLVDIFRLFHHSKVDGEELTVYLGGILKPMTRSYATYLRRVNNDIQIMVRMRKSGGMPEKMSCAGIFVIVDTKTVVIYSS
jgi:hypothetical protein